MEKINLSEPDGTRERWIVAAARESMRLGRSVSVSEFIRNAVEAYDGSTGREQVDPAPIATGVDDHGADRPRVFGRSGAGRRAVAGEPAIRGASAGGAGGFGHGDAGVHGGGPAALSVGGAVKREAVAPEQRESDPAAPPPQWTLGTSGLLRREGDTYVPEVGNPTFRRPYSKERQTGKKVKP